jgi:outer membrane protein W
MKKTSKTQKLVLCLGIFFLFFSIVTAQSEEKFKKNQIIVYGGVNHVLEYGSEEDYVLGENDFPITPTHTPPIFGLALAHWFSKKLGVELDFRYNLSSKVTLEDPSDGDKVKIDTSKHYTLAGNFIYQFSLTSTFKPYLIIGAGFDTLVDVKDEELTTEYGFPLTLYAPKKKTDFVINTGGGIQYFIASNFGIRLDVRYILISADPNNVSGFNFALGAFYKF